MKSNADAFGFQSMLSNLQESGTRWIQSLGAVPTPASLNDAWQQALSALKHEPAALAKIQKRFVDEQQRLMRSMATPGSGGEELASAQDKRFSSAEWQQSPQFRYLAESYLAASRLLLESIDEINLADNAKQRIRFFTKQYLDAVSPANFLVTNPEAIKSAIDSKGASLRAGLENLRDDMKKGHISMTDEAAFRIGENICTTPGSVVFENEIFQLIQYTPTTPDVYLRPLLIVPPCINKYYILDLTPENSFVRYAVEQGFTVFIMSWRNVKEPQGNLTWDDYIADGVVKAIDNVRLITNVERINTLGFCVGGTLLASALAVLRRMGHDVVESMTLLTTFVEFSDVGEIAAYVDEAFVKRRELEVGKGGVVAGSDLAFAFTSLRANELIWNYVVNNYLKGGKPPAFDLLFWNSDSTNLPGPWYTYYLRNTYLENNLVKPDKLTMCGVPVDLSYVDMPAFVFAAREDHIVPWKAAFASATYFGGDVEFVLGASGHIAGTMNPASKNKRSYWAGGSVERGVDKWLAGSEEVNGSWWPHWSEWLAGFSGRKIPARRVLGNAQFRPIEPAPGRYVKESA
ncbi:MAG TPA: class I poly(R)-hydroxyalkanoic acid synthase [Usitatibacteraceae bacterium]|nr:class I poly(R)-hydroxyalkanoic acid synthase [Usitatibacteraceae bacterium]